MLNEFIDQNKIELTLALIQVIGLPVAIIGLLINTRNSARSRDLQVILSLTEQFWINWSERWRAISRKVEEHEGIEELDQKEKDDLVDLFNFLDHIGRLAMSGHIRDGKALNAAISPVVSRTLLHSGPLIAAYRKEDGSEVFRGLLFFQKKFVR